MLSSATADVEFYPFATPLETTDKYEETPLFKKMLSFWSPSYHKMAYVQIPQTEESFSLLIGMCLYVHQLRKLRPLVLGPPDALHSFVPRIQHELKKDNYSDRTRSLFEPFGKHVMTLEDWTSLAAEDRRCSDRFVVLFEPKLTHSLDQHHKHPPARPQVVDSAARPMGKKAATRRWKPTSEKVKGAACKLSGKECKTSSKTSTRKPAPVSSRSAMPSKPTSSPAGPKATLSHLLEDKRLQACFDEAPSAAVVSSRLFLLGFHDLLVLRQLMPSVVGPTETLDGPSHTEKLEQLTHRLQDKLKEISRTLAPELRRELRDSTGKWLEARNLVDDLLKKVNFEEQFGVVAIVNQLICSVQEGMWCTFGVIATRVVSPLFRAAKQKLTHVPVTPLQKARISKSLENFSWNSTRTIGSAGLGAAVAAAGGAGLDGGAVTPEQLLLNQSFVGAILNWTAARNPQPLLPELLELKNVIPDTFDFQVPKAHALAKALSRCLPSEGAPADSKTKKKRNQGGQEAASEPARVLVLANSEEFLVHLARACGTYFPFVELAHEMEDHEELAAAWNEGRIPVVGLSAKTPARVARLFAEPRHVIAMESMDGDAPLFESWENFSELEWIVNEYDMLQLPSYILLAAVNQLIWRAWRRMEAQACTEDGQPIRCDKVVPLEEILETAGITTQEWEEELADLDSDLESPATKMQLAEEGGLEKEGKEKAESRESE